MIVVMLMHGRRTPFKSRVVVMTLWWFLSLSFNIVVPCYCRFLPLTTSS